MTPLAAAILAIRRATGQRGADIARALGCSGYYAAAILRRHDRSHRTAAAPRSRCGVSALSSKHEGINPQSDELVRRSYRCATDDLLAALRRAHPQGEP